MNSRRSDIFPTRGQFLWLLILAGFSISSYLVAAILTNRLGFPLDDAWIHQTYARNLARLGQWAFQPGQPSAGSTAPLWSAMLAFGYWINLGEYLWAFCLGWVLLAVLGISGGRFFFSMQPRDSRLAFWVGVFLVFEWHLVWASGSGMETLLFGFLVLSLSGYLTNYSINWFLVGLLIGLSVWVRPDGITLLGPALWILYCQQSNWRDRLRSTLLLTLGIALILCPYLLFNYILGGVWWPNTFFAKQAEYTIMRDIPLWKRYLSQTGLPLVGAGALLLPGFLMSVAQAIRQRKWVQLGWIIWLLGILFIYAARLPVTYQHGRYLIPAMPMYFILGISGTVALSSLSFSEFWKRVFFRVWLISITVVTIIFWVLGGQAYAMDVAVIESEMVTTANWIAENTAQDAIIAAHDIGALGYFSQRELLDLAGLVSPQVIRFIRDETQLRIFLDAGGANYLMTFPSWYPELVKYREIIYVSDGKFSPRLGGENMTVYFWSNP